MEHCQRPEDLIGARSKAGSVRSPCYNPWGLFKEADLEGILAVTDQELVSSDFLGDPHSAIIDLPLTSEVGRRLFRAVGWYDNEWGHACRIADLLEFVGGLAS